MKPRAGRLRWIKCGALAWPVSCVSLILSCAALGGRLDGVHASLLPSINREVTAQGKRTCSPFLHAPRNDMYSLRPPSFLWAFTGSEDVPIPTRPSHRSAPHHLGPFALAPLICPRPLLRARQSVCRYRRRSCRRQLYVSVESRPLFSLSLSLPLALSFSLLPPADWPPAHSPPPKNARPPAHRFGLGQMIPILLTICVRIQVVRRRHDISPRVESSRCRGHLLARNSIIDL